MEKYEHWIEILIDQIYENSAEIEKINSNDEDPEDMNWYKIEVAAHNNLCMAMMIKEFKEKIKKSEK